MERSVLATLSMAIICSAAAQAAVVEHTFNVGNLTVERLCKTRVITAVSGKFPGPTIRAHDGDTIVVHLVNQSPYNITVHWHGIFQVMSGWADGPSYVTQCPILPGNNYTYRFTISGQEGTLWWHAHVSFLRATVYGALIIKPRHGTKAYPFPQPYKEVPIILGEWWDASVVDVENEALAAGGIPNISDAFTINGRPGDLYPCSQQHTHKVELEQGKLYLFRLINAALSHQFFLKAAGHSFTVVAVDASYTTPQTTQVILLAPGQTVDALLLADAVPAGDYYLAARPFISIPPSSASFAFNNSTTTALLRYSNTTSDRPPPVMPSLPALNDISTAYLFYTNLTGLTGPDRPAVPIVVDERMFVTFGLGLIPCGPDRPMCLAASMNNISFQFPQEMSLLEARFGGGGGGVYTQDFPERPAVKFDFTNVKASLDPSVLVVEKGTKVKRGLGNFNESAPPLPPTFNLLNPQVRNTVAVPAGGWAVIRFVANNPGIWLMHCHLDIHMSWGLAMAFEVDDGPTPSTSLPPPPANLPRC
ncbi:laccase-24-like [Phalaenopsis equestris]|uniref:laccase-24-like n=1 Tax=Phalaenopsis equestris TaxID=78828 RepID=UPI0009E2249C|nr:laccase-24-like [Phalaenopsis equestris]